MWRTASVRINLGMPKGPRSIDGCYYYYYCHHHHYIHHEYVNLEDRWAKRVS